MPRLAHNLFDHYDQKENNMTKALINTLEHADRKLLRRFFSRVGIPVRRVAGVEFRVQRLPGKAEIAHRRDEERKRKTVPDAWILGEDFVVCFEVKIGGNSLYREQLLGHLTRLCDFGQGRRRFLLCLTQTKNQATALADALVNHKAEAKRIRLRMASFDEEISSFVLRESSRPDWNERDRILLNHLRDYYVARGVLRMEGFTIEDFDAVNRDKVKEQKDRIEYISKEIAPKLKRFRDALRPHFSSCGLTDVRGRVSKYWWRSKAEGAWINFSEEHGRKTRKSAIETIHYSLGMTPRGVYFKLHLQGKKNGKRFAEATISDGAREFHGTLMDLANESRHYNLTLVTEGRENSWATPIDRSLKREAVLGLLLLYAGAKRPWLMIERWLWRNRAQDSRIWADGTRLVNLLGQDILKLKPIYDQIYEHR